MNVNWILADNVSFDPTVNITALKDIGSFWGSWKTWRGCTTDNVICHDATKAQELIQQAFHAVCNLYIPSSVHTSLNNPVGVNRYEGTFMHEVDRLDELVTMHLVASISDIVLLMGFDWQKQPPNPDKSTELRLHNYRQLVQQVIKDNPEVQWVLVNHDAELRPALLELENVSKDTLNSVIELLTS